MAMSECPYCQGELEANQRWVAPLPDDPDEDSCQFALSKAEEDGGVYIITVTYPSNACGPINFCPMCGRDLRGGADD